jgi:glycerol kinase
MRLGVNADERSFTEFARYRMIVDMGKSQFILALDQGTTSSRSLLIDTRGEVVAVAQREFTQHFPRSGWVEHDAREIWASQFATIAEVLAAGDASAADLLAIGITNQRETTIVWDRATGSPIAPAIVWQDRRTADVCAALRERGDEPEIAERSGLLLDPYFSGTKIAWLLDNVPGARARAERGELAFGTVDSWLVYQLTRGAHHVTDSTNASRTLLANLATGEWDERLCELLRVPPRCLPRIVPTALSTGEIVADVLGTAVPITGIAGDQQAALFGQACFSPGMAKNTYGTGCFLLLNTGPSATRSAHRLLSTVAWRIGGKPTYALEGAVFVAGAAVQWLRDGLQVIGSAAEIESLAASVPDSDDVYFVPAFTGLGSPHWDPHARGALIGLTRGTTRAHIARATLESMAFQTAELLAAMQHDHGGKLLELRVDGGASANNLLLQFQCDILGVPVVRPNCRESTAMGAAYLAGLGAGVWKSPNEIAALWRSERVFEPQMSRDQAEFRRSRWARAVSSSLGWARV